MDITWYLVLSALIHLYSVSYLTSDRGYARFFAYLNFFVFSMLLLVLAGRHRQRETAS